MVSVSSPTKLWKIKINEFFSPFKIQVDFSSCYIVLRIYQQSYLFLLVTILSCLLLTFQLFLSLKLNSLIVDNLKQPRFQKQNCIRLLNLHNYSYFGAYLRILPTFAIHELAKSLGFQGYLSINHWRKIVNNLLSK